LREGVAALLAGSGGWLWDGSGANPYPAMLGRADAFIATADSVNMVGEAAATGRPIHLFRPTGRSRKIDQFLHGLEQLGALRPFRGQLEAFSYEPIDSTPLIARALAACHLAKRRQGRPL
jgi:mitochondrial fission protein ELM1